MNNYYGYGGRAKKQGGFWKTLFIVAITILLTASITLLLITSLGVLQPATKEASVSQPVQTPVIQATPTPDPNKAAPSATAAPSMTPDISGGKENNANAGDVIVDVAANVGPCVVGVVAFSNDDNVPDDETTFYGSGIVVRSDGYIVTNNHMIDGMEEVYVLLNGEDEEIKAEVVGSDKAFDLAVIKVELENMQAAVLGDSSKVRVGQLAVAIGNPIGLDFFGTVTSGIISGINRQVSVNGVSMNFIQTDASINFGNSGGALINADSEIIGINTAKSIYAGYDDEGNAVAAEGIGLAIPINDAKPIIEQLINGGSITRPYIGITILYLDEKMAAEAELVEGIYIQSVAEGSPADKSGLKTDDIILSMDGVAFTDAQEFSKKVKSHAVGDELDLVVYRNGKELNITVTVGDMNSAD
ncbi:MAG: S1C family serine protease [Christensenellales bacterium]